MSDITYNTVSHGGLKSHQTSLHPNYSHSRSTSMPGSRSTTVTSSSRSFTIKRKSLPSLEMQASSDSLSENATNLTITPQQTLADGESGITRRGASKSSRYDSYRSTSGQQISQSEDPVLCELGHEGRRAAKPVSSSRSPVKTATVASVTTAIPAGRNLAVANPSRQEKGLRDITATSNRPLEKRAVVGNQSRTGGSSSTPQGLHESLIQKLFGTAASPSADRSPTTALASANDKGSWASILAQEFMVRKIEEGISSVRLGEPASTMNEHSKPNTADENSSPHQLTNFGHGNQTGRFACMAPELKEHKQAATEVSTTLSVAVAPRIVSHAKAIKDFHGTGAADELVFLKDAIIEVLGSASQEWGPARKDWWQGRFGDRIGVFPMSHVEVAVFSVQAQSQSPVTRVRVLYDFVPTEDGDLAFKKGDVLFITEAMNESWWMASIGSRTGVIPKNYVEALPVPTSADLFLGEVTHVRTLFHFTTTERGQLFFMKGDVIRLISTRFDGWWLGELYGEEGIFPLSHVEIVPHDSTPTGDYLVDTITGSSAFVNTSWPEHAQAEKDAGKDAAIRRRRMEQNARSPAASTDVKGADPISNPPVSVKVQTRGDKDLWGTLRRSIKQEAAAKRNARVAKWLRRPDSLSSLRGAATAAAGLKKSLAVENLSKYPPAERAQPVIAKTKLSVDIHKAMNIAARGKPEDNFLSCEILLDGIIVYKTKGVTSSKRDLVWNESFLVTINLHFIRSAKLTCILICDCFRHDSLGENLGEALLDFGSINTYDPVNVTIPLKYTFRNKILETGSIMATLRFIEPNQHANKPDIPREYLPFNPVNVPNGLGESKNRGKITGDGSIPGVSNLSMH